MHAHFLDLALCLEQNKSPEEQSISVLNKIRPLPRGSRPLVVLATTTQLIGFDALVEVLSRLPVTVLRAKPRSLGAFTWRWTQELQKQGARVTIFSENPDWLQLVDRRVDLARSLSGRPLIELDTFPKVTGLTFPARVPELLALMRELGVSRKEATELLAKHVTLARAVLYAKDFLKASGQLPQNAHMLTDPDVSARVTKTAEALSFCLAQKELSSFPPPALSWACPPDELDIAEKVVGLPTDEQFWTNFAQWVEFWEKEAPTHDAMARLKRAWSRAMI